jgi:hypothetical protein
MPNSGMVRGLLFSAILIVYLAVPTRNYYWDGIGFAQTIEDSASFRPGLVHPNHLVYNLAGFALYRAVHAIGWNTRALTVLIAANSILSALTAVVVFETLVSSSSSIYLSCVLALLFAFSATWWKFSTDANAYIPSVLLLVMCCYRLLPGIRCRPVLLGALHGGAMLFHELAVLFYPVVVVGILIQSRGSCRQCGLRRAALYTFVALLMVVPAYVAAFYWSESHLDVTAMRRWITYHDPAVGFSMHLAWNFWRTLRGEAQLLLGTKASLIKHESFSLALLVLALTLALLTCAKSIGRRREVWQLLANARKADRSLLLIVGLWIVVYLVFLFFWLPQTTFYRLFYLPALILAIGVLWTPYESNRRTPRSYCAALFLATFALVNFAVVIFPLSKVENTVPVSFAERMHPRWPAGSVIYQDAFGNTINDWYIRYFNPQTEWRPLSHGTIPISDAELASLYLSGRTVWLDTTAADFPQWSQPPLDNWLRKHTRAESTERSNIKGSNIRFIQIFPYP